MSADAERPADIVALTARMAAGDEAAYVRFHELYFHRLHRYLLVVSGGREDATREAVQLALLRVVRHVRKFPSEEAFWSWLTVLARCALVDEGRKQIRYFAFLERFFHRAQAEAAIDSDPDARLGELLDANLVALPPEERELIKRKYFLRESVKEIAAELNATEKAVESHLVRIRRKLKSGILAQLNDESKP